MGASQGPAAEPPDAGESRAEPRSLPFPSLPARSNPSGPGRFASPPFRRPGRPSQPPPSAFVYSPQSRRSLPSAESSGHCLNSSPPTPSPPRQTLLAVLALDVRCPRLGPLGQPSALPGLCGAEAGGGRDCRAPSEGCLRAPQTCSADGCASGSPPSPSQQFYDLQTKLQTNPAGEVFLGAAARGKSTTTRFGSLKLSI